MKAANKPRSRGGKTTHRNNQPRTLVDCREAALRYRDAGFSCFPIEPKGKRPSVRSWKPWQEEIATEHDVHGWFDANSECGVALVMGQVSGGLACRDFDDMAAYDRWAKEHADLAKSLPTVATRRGRHVYFRLTEAAEKELRARLGKPESKGALKLEDGELRLGDCYCVAPPSLHATGSYTWLLGLEHLRSLDPIATGLTEAEPRSPAVDQRDQKTCLLDSLDSLVETRRPDVAEVIERCVLREYQRRHEAVFELARELKAIGDLRELPAVAFREVVRQWWQRSRPYMRNERSFDENWSDFLEGWERVRWPKGKEPILAIMRDALEGPDPPEAEQFDDPDVIKLLKICFALQQAAGDGPFFLASRLAATVMYPDQDVETARQAVTRKLAYLCRPEIGVLEKVSQGSMSSRKANRYRRRSYSKLREAC